MEKRPGKGSAFFGGKYCFIPAASPPRAFFPRRKCGVRRREPANRAAGVYGIQRGPRKIEDFVIRRFCAAPQVRRPTQGARISGDRSLWNPEVPPQNRRFCGEKQNPPFWAGFVIRRFCAAPRVRRPTQGARISGDRSLWNPEGPPQNRRFCGELPHACHFQSRISGRSWPYSAMYCLCSTSLSRMS